MHAADNKPVVVRLLPAFAVIIRGDRVALPSSAQRIVAYAAVRGGHVARSAAAALLWPDLPSERAAASLRSTLWQLRRRAPGVLGADAHALWLSAAACVDYREAVEAARTLTGVWAETFQDDLLVEWGEEWVTVERERYRQIRLHALEELCRRLVSTGNTCGAIEVGISAVSADPLRETGQRALIEAHLADGNISEAVRQYRSFAVLLGTELGVAPTAALTALVGSHADLPRRGARAQR